MKNYKDWKYNSNKVIINFTDDSLNINENDMNKTLRQFALNEAKEGILTEVGRIDRLLRRIGSVPHTLELLRNSLIGNKVKFGELKLRDGNVQRKELKCTDVGLMADNDGINRFYLIDGNGGKHLMDTWSLISYYKKIKRFYDDILDPYGEENWDN